MSATNASAAKAAPKRGRPRKYAPPAASLDEALIAFYAGTLPKKPRNEFERHVMRRRPGRKRNPNCRTQQAAELAVDYYKNCAMSLAAAARRAAEAYGLADPDTVRKYARRLMRPMVTLKRRAPLGPSWLPIGQEDTLRVPFAEWWDAT